MGIKEIFKKIWHFLWEEDSALSWIANVILAIILIKFVFYPVVGFIFGTGFPIVAVVSGSMEHDGSFEEWWNSDAICGNSVCSQKDVYNEYGISKSDFENFIFKNGFNKGDIMVLFGTKPEKIKKGDIIVFMTNKPEPIIHRVVKVWTENGRYYFQTKGDHNSMSIETPMLNEVGISENQIVGRAVLRIPYFGWVKVWFMQFIGEPYCTITNNFFPCKR